MTAPLVDILLLKEHALVEVGIEVALHPGIVDILCPAHKVVDTLLRAVGIIYLQPIALRHHVITHLLQCFGSLLGQQSSRLLITVDTGSHEVIRTIVAYLQNSIWHGICQSHKLAAVIGRTNHRGLIVLTAIAGHYTCTTNNDKDD